MFGSRYLALRMKIPFESSTNADQSRSCSLLSENDDFRISIISHSIAFKFIDFYKMLILNAVNKVGKTNQNIYELSGILYIEFGQITQGDFLLYQANYRRNITLILSLSLYLWRTAKI